MNYPGYQDRGRLGTLQPRGQHPGTSTYEKAVAASSDRYAGYVRERDLKAPSDRLPPHGRMVRPTRARCDGAARIPRSRAAIPSHRGGGWPTGGPAGRPAPGSAPKLPEPETRSV